MEAIDVLLLDFLIGNIAVCTRNTTMLSGPLTVWHRAKIMTGFYFFLIAIHQNSMLNSGFLTAFERLGCCKILAILFISICNPT